MLDPKALTEVKIVDVLPAECPEFISAYIEEAKFEGRPVTDEELWELNSNAEEFINDAAYEVYVENGEIT